MLALALALACPLACPLALALALPGSHCSLRNPPPLPFFWVPHGGASMQVDSPYNHQQNTFAFDFSHWSHDAVGGLQTPACGRSSTHCAACIDHSRSSCVLAGGFFLGLLHDTFSEFKRNPVC